MAKRPEKSSDLLGVRLARNAPVLYVAACGVEARPGTRVLVQLGEGTEAQAAAVVIGTGQMLAAEIEAPAGRVVGALEDEEDPTAE